MPNVADPNLPSLPQGRLLCRPLDEARYVAVMSPGLEGYWIVEDGWSRTSKAAGPFAPNQTLRALRLANTMVPDGCERGPWQPGLELFPCAYLQRHANDWSHVALHLLPPGATFYRAAEHPFIVNERCCAPGAEKPRLNRGGPLHHDVARLEALSVTDANDKRMRLLGVLLREWNAHPEGSAVLGTTLAFDEDFAVLDLPPDP